MSDTYFIDQTTPINAAWLNDVNKFVYHGIPAGTLPTATNVSATPATNNSGVTVQAQLTNVGSATGASNVGYMPAGTGAVATTVQHKLREQISAYDFGVLGDGSDETAKIQAAINAANARGIVEILFEPNKTFVVKQLVPMSGAILNLNGSTLKLADNANVPIVFDGGIAGGGGHYFGVYNGTLDCNQANGNSNLNIVGGIWLTTWSNLYFSRLVIKNCSRIGLNLVGCNHFFIKDYTFQDSGIVGSAYIAYALNIESQSYGSQYIEVKNVQVSNVVGFGIHFYGCSNFTADSLSFSNLSYGTVGIAITFTEAYQGRITNVTANLVDGDSIEINDTSDLILDNFKITQTGNRALLMGTNTPGHPYNTRLKISNFTSSSTGGAASAAISFCQDSIFENCNFDKQITSDISGTLSQSIMLRNCTIGTTFGGSPGVTYFQRFLLDNVTFTDLRVRTMHREQLVVSMNIALANGAVQDLVMTNLAGANLYLTGVCAGTLRTQTVFAASPPQGSYQKCEFLVDNYGSSANLSAVTTVSGSVARALTIAGDAANKQLTLTNGSGVDLNVAIELDFVTFK